jgi:hypothetical protein
MAAVNHSGYKLCLRGRELQRVTVSIMNENPTSEDEAKLFASFDWGRYICSNFFIALLMLRFVIFDMLPSVNYKISVRSSQLQNSGIDDISLINQKMVIR